MTRSRRQAAAQSSRRIWRGAVIGLTVLAVMAFAVDRSGIVGIDTIEVVGNLRVSDAEVRQAMALEVGTSHLRLRPGQVTRRVEELPAVAHAELRRSGVDRVTVEVTERRPVMQVDGPGRSVLIDREGIVMTEGVQGGLPVTLLAVDPPAVGGRAEEIDALANAHAVWRGLSGPLRSDVAWFEADSVDELVIVLDRGVRVMFGRAERLDEKVRALGAVLEDLGDTEVELVDVRAPATPIIVTP